MGLTRSMLTLAPILFAMAIVGVVLPYLLPDYMMTTLILFFVWAVVAQSWNLVWGIAGVWSLGQLAIFAMGGYCTGWLIIYTGMSPFLAAPIGIVAAVATSAIMALPCIRLKGVYVILMTISFHEVFRILLTTDTSGFTGGLFGLPHYQGFVSEELTYAEKTRAQYYIGLCMFLAATAVVWLVLHSRLGLAFKAIGQAPLYAASRGVSLFRTQMMAFIVGGAVAGTAGAFWAQYFGTMQPGVLSFDTMVYIFAMMVIGGWGTFSGPILGAILLVWLSEFLHEVQEYRLMILGSIIVVASVALPEGIAPRLGRYLGWLRQIIVGGPAPADEEAGPASSRSAVLRRGGGTE